MLADQHGFIPPYPPRPAERLPPREMLRRSRQNLLSAFEEKAFRYQFIPFKAFSRHIFICNSPDTVRHAFVTANAAFERKSPQMRRALRPLIGDGLFVSDGETWRTRRRIVGEIVHGSRVPGFAPLMVETALELRDRWAGLHEIDALREMAHLTAEIICRTIFGRTLGRAAAAEIVDGFRDYQSVIDQLDTLSLIGVPDWVPRPRSPLIGRSARRIHATIDQVIAAYRPDREDDETSVVGMLLRARDETGAPLSRDAIRNEAVVIFMAGHETTANTLAWTWYLLANAPLAESRLHGELDAVLQGRPPRHADLPRLVYTRAIIEESLRLYPAVPVLAREAVEDEAIRGRTVPAGSLVLVAPWLLHRHRLYWDHPDSFVPERFLPDAAAPEKYAYLPFGAGPRVCAGLTFALAEAILSLATLAQTFSLRMRPGALVEPTCRITLRPAGGIPMTLHRRGAPPAGTCHRAGTGPRA